MKIACQTSVVYRKSPGTMNRCLKATLAIGFHPPQTTAKSESQMFVIHFTGVDKTGNRYRVRENIVKVFTNFVHEGKATISFVEPPHDIQIKCNAVQLKVFLRALALGIAGKPIEDVSPQFRSAVIAATPVPERAHIVRKLRITKRSEYPILGLPRTLESLTITGIGFLKIQKQILTLRNLTSINLSANALTNIPLEFGNLALVDLDLSSNRLGRASLQTAWSWLDRESIQRSLVVLNLRENELKWLPPSIVRLQKLGTLNVDGNQISRLPYGIQKLMSLRILRASENQLESLPAPIYKLRIEVLSIARNRLNSCIVGLNENEIAYKTNLQTVHKQPVPLWQLAAIECLSQKIPLAGDHVPAQLALCIETAPRGECGHYCFTSPFIIRRPAHIFSVKEISYDGRPNINIDSMVCSWSCAQDHLQNLNGGHLIDVNN